MPKTVLILGGTKGLGLALAWGAYYLKFNTIIAGRSVADDNVRATFPPDSGSLVLDLANPASCNNIAYLQSGPIDYIFWVAGILSRKPFGHFDIREMDQMTSIHLLGPLYALRLLHASLAYKQKHPYHLITIASTSSWRIRENESLYCALKAAKAAFTRNFARELVRDLPGSKVTLINPGGIKTGLLNGTGQDTSNFMDPKVVSRTIWNEVVSQKTPFHEVQILRNNEGSPNVSYGSRLPEMPFQE
ncbi:MAG: hypothetical protein A2816_00050 [Candidatus Yanofskybacteria bacterium RIFCSPHIGHO2_01_FULL_39_44]|nr:MAG: hypothetical protein A2816_00050 [Candidatus Yanofskybacteria bacterium RIFCSPHIGHO2_01_FULL_39_44]